MASPQYARAPNDHHLLISREGKCLWPQTPYNGDEETSSDAAHGDDEMEACDDETCEEQETDTESENYQGDTIATEDDDAVIVVADDDVIVLDTESD